MRHFTAYAAGMSELGVHHFALFAYSGAVLWVSAFIGLGYFLGERWEAVERDIHHYLVMIAVGAAILAGAWLVWRKWRRSRRAK